MRMSQKKSQYKAFLTGPIVVSSIVSTKRGVPFVPGLLLMALGITALVAPRLIFGAIAFCLLALGFLFCYLAYRIAVFRRQINSLAKNLEGSLYGSRRGSGFSGSGFSSSAERDNLFGDKPDIDITDFENGKKIVYH